MLKIVVRFFINYFCPYKNKIKYDEMYFEELLLNSKNDFINSLLNE